MPGLKLQSSLDHKKILIRYTFTAKLFRRACEFLREKKLYENQRCDFMEPDSRFPLILLVRIVVPFREHFEL